jgi:hypothetical protein
MSTWYLKNGAIMVRKPEREHLGEDAPETVCEMISSLSPVETSRNARPDEALAGPKRREA